MLKRTEQLERTESGKVEEANTWGNGMQIQAQRLPFREKKEPENETVEE